MSLPRSQGTSGDAVRAVGKLLLAPVRVGKLLLAETAEIQQVLAVPTAGSPLFPLDDSPELLGLHRNAPAAPRCSGSTEIFRLHQDALATLRCSSCIKMLWLHHNAPAASRCSGCIKMLWLHCDAPAPAEVSDNAQTPEAPQGCSSIPWCFHFPTHPTKIIQCFNI